VDQENIEAMNAKANTNEEIWQTSITELVCTFRDCLAAVAPLLERARFRTEEPNTSDDWDNVAEALFENIVGRSIRWSAEVGQEVQLGPYATIHRDYEERPRIEVIPIGRPASPLIFHSLVSSRERFDRVAALTLRTLETVVVPLAGSQFVLRLPGASSTIHSLTVQL
jgi:hypothetical protein